MTPPPDPADGEGPGDFLSRWSARKRAEARAAGAEPKPAPAGPAPPPPPQTAEPDPDLLARLPRIEDIGPGTDIRPFLQAGVPRALRNAALRRVWTTDPVISTYEDPARDYFWDYNAPGLAGHGGPLSPEAVAAMARRLAGGAAAAPPEAPAAAAAAAGPPGAAESAPPAAPAADAAVRAPAPAPAPPTAPAPAAASASAEAPPRRRHGGATPA